MSIANPYKKQMTCIVNSNIPCHIGALWKEVDDDTEAREKEEGGVTFVLSIGYGVPWQRTGNQLVIIKGLLLLLVRPTIYP